MSKAVMGQMLLLNLQTGEYYALNEPATLIWTELSKQTPVEQIGRRLTEEFEVDSARAASDLSAILGEWQKLGFVES